MKAYRPSFTPLVNLRGHQEKAATHTSFVRVSNMASSAPTVALTEHQEDLGVVDQKATVLANLIQECQHFIAVTGAGISTAAGQPPIPHDEQLRGRTINILQGYLTFVALKARGLSWRRDASAPQRLLTLFELCRHPRTWLL